MTLKFTNVVELSSKACQTFLPVIKQPLPLMLPGHLAAVKNGCQVITSAQSEELMSGLLLLNEFPFARLHTDTFPVQLLPVSS